MRSNGGVEKIQGLQLQEKKQKIFPRKYRWNDVS